MAKMVQIRNVPEALHRQLKKNAEKAGLSLSEYLLREMRKAAAQPTMEELMERIKKQKPVKLTRSIVEVIREMRGPLGD